MNDPYQEGKIPPDIYTLRKSVKGVLVAVMDHSLPNRKLQLILQPTRALKKFEIVEMISTEEDIPLGGEVNAIAYLGFSEILEGGVIKRGDIVEIGNRIIGEILGYDETHMPNHMNVILKMQKKETGTSLQLQLDEEVRIN